MNPGIERDKTIDKLQERSREQHTEIRTLKEQVQQLTSLVALLIQDREATAWTVNTRNPDGSPLSRYVILQLVASYLRPLIAILPPTFTRELKGNFVPYVEALLGHMKEDPEKLASWTQILEYIKAENITPEDMGMRVLEDGSLKVIFGPKPRSLFGYL